MTKLLHKVRLPPAGKLLRRGRLWLRRGQTRVARWLYIVDAFLRPYTALLHRAVQPRNVVLALSVALPLTTAAYTIQFFWPRTIEFAFSAAHCFSNPVFLPTAVDEQASAGFDVHLTPSLSIAGYPLYSHTTCVTPTELPAADSQQSVKLAPLGSKLFKKNIEVAVDALPAASPQFELTTPVSIREPLVFSLDQPDELFYYRLSAGDSTVVCAKETGDQLACDLSELGLTQGQAYRFTLEQLFHDQPVHTVFQESVTTVEPVQVVSASIAAGETVYGVPTEISLTLNKPVSSWTNPQLASLASDGTPTALPVTASHNGTAITVSLSQPLPRDAALELRIDQIEAADSGFLPAPYILSFRTSGGPKVTHINVGSTKVGVDSNLVLSFDAGLAAGQNMPKFVSVEAGGAVLEATVTAGGRTVTINPTAALPRCAAFTVRVKAGLVNEFGVGEGQAWQFSARTICQVVFSIGTSVNGRGLTAYRFGSGPSVIIFVGGLHGDEKSSVFIMNSWIGQLEARADRIPAHRTIVVIPNLNPDGYAASSRYNAHGIDLNRNFPSNTWNSSNGGGSEPLSEPESRAIYNYVLGQSPRLVLSYHAAGGVVMPNEAGDSQALASEYAAKSSVGYLSGGSSGEFFGYAATGTFEGWLDDKLGLPALLIELITKSGREFNGHTNALWYITQLP